MGTLDHERMEVYALVRSYNRMLSLLLKRLDTAGASAHVDQLRRAGASVALNLAEGTGEFAPREKARFYRIARRSATESAAGLDYLVDAGMATESDVEPCRNLLRRVVAILVTLSRKNEASDPRGR